MRRGERDGEQSPTLDVAPEMSFNLPPFSAPSKTMPNCPKCGKRLEPHLDRTEFKTAYVEYYECTNPKCPIIRLKKKHGKLYVTRSAQA